MNASAAALIVDGFRLQAMDAGGRSWVYLPACPMLERDGAGAPMLSIVEAGSFAFFQATARLALSEARCERLLGRLKAVRPRAERLSVARIRVARVALEVREDAGWRALAESTTSGSAPWTAALSATLTPHALAGLRAAVGGEAGRARLRAWITLPSGPARYRSVETSRSAHTETSMGVASSLTCTSTTESASSLPPATLELESDIAHTWSAKAERNVKNRAARGRYEGD